jgi:tight adherence protein B
MILLGLVFLVVLILTFTVVMILTRPTATDRAIEGRIAGIQAASQGIFLGEGVPEIFKSTQLSEIGWLDVLLQRWNVFHKLRLLASQAESSWSVPVLLAISAGCAGAGFAISYYYLGEWIIASVAGLVSLFLPLVYLNVLRGRRLKRFNQALPDALDLITRALRAGHSISAAIEIVGQEAAEPVRTEFREVYRRQNFGLPHREALLELASRVPSQDLQFVITAMLVQKETGGNLVETLDRTAVVVRDRIRIQGEVRTYTAQGRMTGYILGALPIIMFFLINLANHGYARVLVDDPTGRKLIYAGAAGMVLGGLMIRKIVNVKV